jgi:signal transduction histidine kinase/CheY-like chemotaxis protein
MTGRPDTLTVLSVRLPSEREVFALRRDAQAAFRLVGLSHPDTVRLATVLSEVGRDLLGAPDLIGRLKLVSDGDLRVAVEFHWSGPTTPSPEILQAAERLLDRCEWNGRPPPAVVLSQPLPMTDETPAELAARARDELVGLAGASMSEQLRSQNHDLLVALQQARAHQEELQRLNAELEETNQGVMALYSELSKELEATNTGVVALYAELEEKTRQLSLVSEAKTRFWANVSHELRSPVNTVIGLARLLLDPAGDPLTAEQRRQVALIASSGNTLLALVEELLDVAKAESGRLEPELVRVDLRPLLHQLRGTLAGAARPGVAFTVCEGDGPADRSLATDGVMLTRILRNLLSNSLKFTDTGEVRLTVEYQDRAGQPWCLFTVTDSGIGIPPEEQARIFEEFYQVRGPHQRAGGGTGLGLPYARKLTELLGGRLQLTSVPGEGTRVVVELPVHPPGSGQATAAPTGPVLDSLVVVDDDPAFLATLRPALEDLARSITEVTDSAAAVRTIRVHPPDAVLLDLSMPPPDGYQVLDQLAHDPVLADVPVIVVTTTDHEYIDRSRLGHARAVLGKTHLTAARLAGMLPHPRARGQEENGTAP